MVHPRINVLLNQRSNSTVISRKS